MLFHPLSIEIFHCDKCIWVFHLVTIYLPPLFAHWVVCMPFKVAEEDTKNMRSIGIFHSVNRNIDLHDSVLCLLQRSILTGHKLYYSTSIEILRLPLANDLDHHHMILDISGGWAEMQRTVLFLHCCNFLSFTITSPVHDPIRSYVDRGDI